MNQLRHHLAIGLGRSTVMILRALGRQASTLPGKLCLKFSPNALADQSEGLNVILVTGTNGKTTTTSVLTRLLETSLPEGTRIHTNEFGANLASGMMTTLLKAKRGDYAVLECDEGAFARYAGSLKPRAVVLTNIFRDQLDRYGELDTVLKYLRKGSVDAGASCKIVLCGDDPNVASIARDASGKAYFFGVDSSELDNRSDTANLTDSAHCPICGQTLDYRGRSMSHLGDYHCPDCDYGRPSLNLTFKRLKEEKSISFLARLSEQESVTLDSPWPLDGLYNAYNAAAAALAAKLVYDDFSVSDLRSGLARVKPAFGRLERIPYEGKEVCFVLVKNPAGIEQGIRLVCEADDVASVIFFLNNRINDGVDVSWIWDAPFENFSLPDVPLGASGERAGDMALRLDYAYGPEKAIKVERNATALVKQFLDACPPGKTVYLLPNYSAMMDLRKELAEHLGYDKIVGKEA